MLATIIHGIRRKRVSVTLPVDPIKASIKDLLVLYEMVSSSLRRIGVDEFSTG